MSGSLRKLNPVFAVLPQTQDEPAFCFEAKLCPCAADHGRHRSFVRLDLSDVDNGELQHRNIVYSELLGLIGDERAPRQP
jgi:hypothetical protein